MTRIERIYADFKNIFFLGFSVIIRYIRFDPRSIAFDFLFGSGFGDINDYEQYI
jgi:hypothetical protein